MTSPQTDPQTTAGTRRAPVDSAAFVAGFARVHRGSLIALAIIGVVLGIIGLVFPGATLFTVSILFGSYLIASGLFRIVAAVIDDRLDTGLRWLSAILGLFVLIAGIVALANPFVALFTIVVFVSLGWIIDGIIDFLEALRHAIEPRWLGFVSGIASIAAGVALLVLPTAGLAVLVQIGAVLLIVVSVTSLLTLPRKTKAARPDLAAA